MPDEGGLELTVDELARRAGVTVRNVRAYQDKGLIPPPTRRGRVGIYTELHLLRLRLIKRLLERGYNLANIRELLAAFDQGQGVADFVGIEGALSSPWSTEVPGYVTLDEVMKSFGATSPNALAKAIELGMLEPEGDRFRVPSPRVYHAGEELVRAGIPLEAVLEQAAALREDIEHVAAGFAELVAQHLFDAPYGSRHLPPPGEMPRLAAIITRLRPLAEQVVTAELSRALEQAVHDALGDRLARVLDHEE